jgi:hypothetical protein
MGASPICPSCAMGIQAVPVKLTYVNSTGTSDFNLIEAITRMPAIAKHFL